MLEHMPFNAAIGVTLALDALLLVFLSWAFRSPGFAKFHIRAVMPMRVTRTNYRATVASTGLLSMIATVGLVYGLAPYTITVTSTPWWMITLQAVGVLVVYDFGYYFLHRFLHIRAIMPYVHGIHHRVRFPSALESLYLSPIEMLAGLLLLMAVIAGLGPIHWIAFVVVFFIYSTLHIVIHSGMIFPHELFGVRVFALANYLTIKHHRHHLNKHGHNFASVTPLPDLIFRTSI